MIVDELGRIPMSQSLAATLARAGEYARAQSHVEVTLEHLLLALTEDQEASLVLKSSRVDLARLAGDISSHLGRIEERASDGSMSNLAVASDLRRILEAAAAAAQQTRRREINGAIVLAAIVGDGKSTAAHLLRAHGLTFEEAIKALQRTAAPPAGPSAPPHQDQPPPAAPPAPPSREAEPQHMPQPAPAPAPAPAPPSVAAPARSPSTEEILASARERVMARAREQREAADAAATAPQRAPEPLAEPPPALAEPEQWRAPSLPEPAPAQPAPPAPVVVPALPPAVPAQAPPPGHPLHPGSAAAGGAMHPHRPLPPSAPSAAPPLPPPPAARAPWPLQPPSPPPVAPPATAPSRLPPQAAPGASHGYAADHAGPPPFAAPVGVPSPVAPPRQKAAAAPPAGRPRVEAGQLVENIPRTMRVEEPVIVEVRIAKSSVKAIAEGMQGSAPVHRHEVAVTKAMAVRLRAPDGGFSVEPASPETQWIENTLGLMSDDFASWRWAVTPRRRGKGRLVLIVSARTVAADGLAAETALPDQVIEVRVRTNYAKSAVKWAGWVAAAIAGGILAKFGEGFFEASAKLAAKLMAG